MEFVFKSKLLLVGDFAAGVFDFGRVHDHVADFIDDCGGLLCEEQALAELTTVVVFVEKGIGFAQARSQLKGEVQGRHRLTVVHISHHHQHGLSHVEVVLDDGRELGFGAAIVFELFFAREEDAGLGAAHELSIPSAD